MLSHPGHEIVKCSCGAIIKQCRCPDKNKTVRVLEAGCDVCQMKLQAQPRKKSRKKVATA